MTSWLAVLYVALLPLGRSGLPFNAQWGDFLFPILAAGVRLRGAFEAPELLGNALLVAFVLSLGLRAVGSVRSRPFWTGMATLLAAGEFLTFSHSVAGFCVATAIFAAGSLTSRALRRLLWSGALVVFLAINCASAVIPVQRNLSGKADLRAVSVNLFGTRVDAQLDTYLLLKRVSWSAFIEHPLTGIGPGRFVGETHRAFAQGRITRHQRGLAPHSSVLGRLAESGVMGGISLLLLWAAWIRACSSTLTSASPMRRAAFAAVLGLLVNSLNVDIMNFRFLWIALAWAWAPPGAPTATPRAFAHP